jgi:3',5'-cyclic AMP phosphodiesterase CpdA
VIILLFAASPAYAGDDQSTPARVTPLFPVEKQWEPSAVPDRIVLSWSDDPATTMSVTWRTDTSVRRAIAEIAPAEGGPKFVDQRKPRPAESQSLDTDLGPSLRHTVTFEGLKPQTQYLYRVGDGTNWSEWADFQTASVDATPFSFVYFGDAQNDVKSHWSRVVRRAFRDAPKASFFIHAGDLINRSESDAEWGEWFYASGFIHRSIPCLATPGNHEFGRIGESDERRLSIHWQPQFAFPQNGPDGLRESAYWFDFQGTRFVSLNSNEKLEDQAQWLDTVLADNTNQWTVLTFHHPIYSAKAGRDNPHLRALWQPVIDRHHVDLVLQGHDHTYARSQLMTADVNLTTGVSHLDPNTGTVYVVSVSGPKMYELGRRPFMRRAAEDTQLFQIITIDGLQLKYEARTAIGELYDGFVLRKEEGARRTLIEQIPGSREARRLESEREKRPKAEDVVREWLKNMDKDKNGKLTRDELPADLQVYFNAVDTNKDDACSFDELVKGARSLGGAE